MADYLLVHGAWHTADCWATVAHRLTSAGHRVDAINLPGRDNDGIDPLQVSLATHTNHISNAVSTLDSPIVVAHSLSGFWASHAMEQVAQNVRCLAFLCAYVPLNGKSAADVAPLDPHSEIHNTLVADAENGTSSLPRTDKTRRMLYGECDAAIASAALNSLVPEPFFAAMDPLTLSDTGFHATNKVYIECLRDHVISINYQRQMQRNADFDLIVSVDTDHSPFLSRPDELTEHLLELTERYAT